MNHNINNGNALDYIKLIMAFLVIAIHTIMPTTHGAFILTQGIARIAVPFFFIASGYFFSSNPTRSDLLKTIYRLTALYLLWCILYSPYIVNDIHQSSSSLLDVFRNALYLLIKGWRHLWFMPALIFGIITHYILRKSKFIYLIAFIFYLLGLIIENSIQNSDYSIILYRNFLIFGFPLITLGHFLRGFTHNNSLKLNPFALVITSLLALLIESNIKYHYSLYNNDILMFAPIASASLFILFLNMRAKVSKETRAVSTSIYFLHFIFVLVFKNTFESQFNFFLMVSLCTFLLSISLIRLPIYRKLFT